MDTLPFSSRYCIRFVRRDDTLRFRWTHCPSRLGTVDVLYDVMTPSASDGHIAHSLSLYCVLCMRRDDTLRFRWTPCPSRLGIVDSVYDVMIPSAPDGHIALLVSV